MADLSYENQQLLEAWKRRVKEYQNSHPKRYTMLNELANDLIKIYEGDTERALYRAYHLQQDGTLSYPWGSLSDCILEFIRSNHPME